MDPRTELEVTLPPSLYAQLVEASRRVGLPLKWLVAALVAELLNGDVPARPAA